MARRKKILIHSIVFSPDGVSTAYIYNDIALAFRGQGYEVVVITTTPHYNVVEAALEKQPLKKCAGGLFYKSEFYGIPVFHVPQKKFKSFAARAAGFVYWHVISFFLGITQRHISVILSPSPPLTIGLVSIMIGWIKMARVIYNVQEIYPDLLINHGSLRSPLLLNVLKRLERFVYNHSDRVVTIDEVFYATIMPRFRDASRLSVIPNFVDTDLYRPDAGLVSQLDRSLFPDTDALKVMYAGNIGHAQDWEPLLAAAIRMRGLPVEFWVVGEGVLKEELQKRIESQSLSNIHLVPYQSREKIPAIVNYADIHFIFMSPSMEGQGFPSKVYTIMATGKPMLVTSGEGTPLHNFLKDKNCAFLISETNLAVKTEAIIAALSACISDRTILADMGSRAMAVISSRYSKKAVTMQYVSLSDALTAPS